VIVNLLRELIAKARTESSAGPAVDVEGAPRVATSDAGPDAEARSHNPYLAWLRDGRIADAEFDDVYPTPARAVSSTFWTPVRVARRAAELLVIDSATRVLDIGSGAGKFCIVGAATTGAQFVGVEQRAHLVATARAAAASIGVTTARFIHGTFDTVEVSAFGAIYLYNPFEENLWDHRARIDDTVELSRPRFLADVERIEHLLAEARVGTRVVTYHGFGGCMPPAYRLELREPCESGHLDLWVRGEDPPGAYTAYRAPGPGSGFAAPEVTRVRR